MGKCVVFMGQGPWITGQNDRIVAKTGVFTALVDSQGGLMNFFSKKVGKWCNERNGVISEWEQ
jgi:hypothetical protein